MSSFECFPVSLSNKKKKLYSLTSDGLEMTTELQNIFEKLIRDHPNEIDDVELNPIPKMLLQCLHTLYEFTPASQSIDVSAKRK